MRSRLTIGFAVLAVLATACDGASPRPAASPRPSLSSPATGAPAALGCPAVTSKQGGFAAIDYVDFIQAFGQQYIANLSGHSPRITRADLGAVVMRSRCSFATFNDRTHRSPGEAREGDTGFLPIGTPIYALNGWPTKCRLAAQHDGRLSVYLAYRDDTKTAQPRECALPPSS